MYSNRFIAIHCCKEIYNNEIIDNGISKDTKAVFLVDINNIDYNVIFNTLAVLIYHGIGIDGWNNLLNNNYKNINNDLDIIYALIEKYQEKIIIDNNITNFYKIENERTLNYCKIKDIGAIKNIKYIEKIELGNIVLIYNDKINLSKDRFFIKNTYNNIEIKHNRTTEQIRKICFKIAKKNIVNMKQVIKRIVIEEISNG